MSLRPTTFGLTGPLALAITLVLTGCSRTLVYAEQTSFNLSIVAKPSEATPLNVNIGLDRTVASLVPPIHENTPQGMVDGEGVNMFAGFAVHYDPATLPFAGNLRIRTQFASGQAATTIAGDPDTVARVVNVADIPLGALTPISIRDQIPPLRRKIQNLSDPQMLNLARDLGLVRPNESLSPSEAKFRVVDSLDVARLNETDFGRFKAAVDTVAGK
jgi:hypothetical protein